MRRDLTKLFQPESVVLVGASADTIKWGGWVARSFAEARERRRTYFVSRRGGEIYGIPVHTSVAEIGEPLDLAVIVVPAPGVPEAVTQALALGATAIVIISAGFAEVGLEGAAVQAELVEEIRAAGAVLLGPNCLGLFDDEVGLNVYGGTFPSGDLGFASQSGNLALEVALLLEHVNLGLSRFASVGNQADLTLADIIRDLAYHEPTKVIGAYVEAPADGPAFAEAVREASAIKPVVLFQAGRTSAGQKAAASHTGQLAAESRVLRAVARDAGAAVVDTPGAFVDAVSVLRTGRALRGTRIAVVADGGGHGVVASDVVTEAGLEMATLTPETLAALEPNLGNVGPQNPVDLAGAGESDLWNFHRLSDTLLRAPEVDAVVLSGFFGGYGDYNASAGEREIEISAALGASSAAADKPMLVHSMLAAQGTAAISALRQHDVPTFGRIEDLVAALACMRLPRPVVPGASLPVPDRTLSDRPAYPEAREVLQELGVDFPAGRLATTAEEAASAVEVVGAPVALKAVAAELLHKTDAGGVVLGVVDADVAAETFSAMVHRVEGVTGLALDGVWVEHMQASGGVDLVVGARRDPSFGAVVLIGVGGVFVEILDDVVIAPAPTDVRHLVDLMQTLRAFPMLAGARGQDPVDCEAVARIAVRLGDLLIAHPEIIEVEINPLRATGEGATALDARIVCG